MLVLKNKKIFLSICLIVICTLLMGCFPDLGAVSSADDYADKFSSVKFVKKDLIVESMSITELSNDNAINNFQKKDFVCPTESNAYKYMAVFAGQTVKIKEFAIYLKSETDVKLSICVYNLSDLPSVIAIGTDDDYETYQDPDSGEEKTKLKDFDEPKDEDAIATLNISLKANVWNSFVIKSWTTDREKKSNFTLNEDRCLVFQIKNNCIRYNSSLNENPLDSANICFTSMLIYVDKEG